MQYPTPIRHPLTRVGRKNHGREAHIYPSRFNYEAPRSLESAIDLLRAGGGEAKVLAGGQSLIPLLKLRFASPEMLVDINNIPELDYHRIDPDGTIRVGALCRHADLEHSTVLASKQPHAIVMTHSVAPIGRQNCSGRPGRASKKYDS